MVANERDKSASLECSIAKCFAALLDELQFLMFRVTDRRNHSAAFSELRKERLGNRGSRGGDKNGVERRKFRQTECSITAMNVYVRVAEPCQARRRRKRQLGPSLHAKHFSGQAREDSGLVTTTRADFEHAIARPYMQCCRHRSDDIWLRNSLAVADGQGHIVVRLFTKLPRNKFVPGNGFHGRKDRSVGDAAPPQLRLNHV